jgi:hypothetical protein
VRPEDLKSLLLAGSLIGLATLTTSAFSINSKQKIWDRANSHSELSGENTVRMECNHMTHDKASPLYDDPRNGMLVTIAEHYSFHLMFRGRAGEIGLSENHNEYAIRECRYRLEQDGKDKGYFFQIPEIVELATQRWNYFLNSQHES